jgi:hypothetical protein
MDVSTFLGEIRVGKQKQNQRGRGKKGKRKKRKGRSWEVNHPGEGSNESPVQGTLRHSPSLNIPLTEKQSIVS